MAKKNDMENQKSILTMISRPIVTIKDSEIVEALRECKGLTYLASMRLGCTHSDLDNRVKGNEFLSSVCRTERGVIVDKAEAKLVEAMESGAKWAIELILKTLGKERGYVERQEVHNLSKVQLHIIEEIVDGGTAPIPVEARIISSQDGQAPSGPK
jgi:hypothetical protein